MTDATGTSVRPVKTSKMGIFGGIYSFIRYLNQAEHVASIQNLCGIEIFPTVLFSYGNSKVCNGNEFESGHSRPHLQNGNSSNGLKYRNGYKHSIENGSSSKSNGVHDLHANGFQANKESPIGYYSKPEISTVTSLQNNSSGHQKSHYKYSINNKILYYLFLFGAGLGNEVFYITFFPFLAWNIDSQISRQIYMVLWIMMYIGQASKDIIRWERPKSPPVIRIEKLYETEYSMPSTHAISGSCMPVCLLLLTISRYEVSLIWMTALAISWCFLVCSSRIYLGMHTILDILVGLALVAVLLPPLLYFSHTYDLYTTTHPLAVLTTPLIALLLSYLYPSQRWSTAVGDTITLVSVGAGLQMGAWLNNHLGYMTHITQTNTRILLSLPSMSGVLLGTVRFVIGMIVLLMTRAVMKPLARRAAEFVLAILGSDKSKGSNQKRAEILYKFCTYISVAFNTTFTAPLILSMLNIGHALYYHEI